MPLYSYHYVPGQHTPYSVGSINQFQNISSIEITSLNKIQNILHITMYTHLYCWQLHLLGRTLGNLWRVFRNLSPTVLYIAIVMKLLVPELACITSLYCIEDSFVNDMLNYDIHLLRTFIEYLYVPVNLSMPRNRAVFVVRLFPPHPALNSTPDTALQYSRLSRNRTRKDWYLQNLEYPGIRYDAHAQVNYSLQSSSKLHYDQLPYKYYSYIRNIMQCSMATKEI